MTGKFRGPAAFVVGIALILPAAGLFAQTSRELRIGSWTSGTIRNGTEDWFSLRIAEDGILTVETSGDTDTYLELYNAAGDLLGEDDDGGDGGNARLDVFVGAGNTYRIKTRGYDGDVSGSYRLLASFEVLPPDTERNTARSRAAAITPGTPATGYLRAASESRWYRLNVPAGGKQVVAYTQGNTDTVMKFYDSQGTLLAEDDDGGSGVNARISMLAPAGALYIEIREYDGKPGRYTAYAEIREDLKPDRYENDNIRAAAKDIAVGANQERTFTDASDVDWVCLRITQTAVYEIRSSAADDVLDCYLRLYDSSDTLLAEDDDSGGGYDAMIEQRLNPGTYYIEVTTLDSDPLKDNRYTISVSRIR